MDDDLYKLDLLSLVNKLTQEINNHTGMNDTALAEFVISLHEKSKSKDKFVKKLKQNGAEFPPTLVDNLDRLILQLHPKYKKKKQDGNTGDGVTVQELDKKARMFPGLSMPDQDWKPAEKVAREKDATTKEVDDLFAKLEGVAKKRPLASDFLPEDPPHAKRSRPSPPPPSSARRRSTSPPPPRDRRYDEGPRGRDRDRYGSSRRPLDERPVLYKIYDGKVTNLKDFGAFVQLEGVVGRVEGMIPSYHTNYDSDN